MAPIGHYPAGSIGDMGIVARSESPHTFSQPIGRRQRRLYRRRRKSKSLICRNGLQDVVLRRNS